MTTRSTAFDRLLLCAIDEVLKARGKSVRPAVYLYTEDQFRVTRYEIPRNLGQFQEVLEAIFGADAQVIEGLIIAKLDAKLGRLPIIKKSGQIGFLEYVTSAKQKYVGNVTQTSNTKPVSFLF